MRIVIQQHLKGHTVPTLHLIDSLLTLINAAHDSILDFAVLIGSAVVGLTNYSLAWDATAALLAHVQQNLLIGLLGDLGNNKTEQQQ